MKTQHNQVKEFHETFRHPIARAPILPDMSEKVLRYKMLTEEVNELYAACSDVEYADAIVDILYVVLGAAVSAGISGEQIEAAFAEVHRSNMSKLWTWKEIVDHMPEDYLFVKVQPDLFTVRNQAGKFVKPLSYSPPNLAPILEGVK